jgi:hypothetical protein
VFDALGEQIALPEGLEMNDEAKLRDILVVAGELYRYLLAPETNRFTRRTRRLFTWSFYLGQWLFVFGMASALFMFYFSRPEKGLLPGVAKLTVDEDISDYPPVYAIHTAFFRDGALCATTVRASVDRQNSTSPKIGDTVYGLDPQDSARTITYKVAANDPPTTLETIDVCSVAVPGSTSDPQAKWRRGPGYQLAILAFWGPPLSPVIAVLVLTIFGLLAFAGLGIVIAATAACVRLLWILARLWRIPNTQPWEPVPALGAQTRVLHLTDLHVVRDGIPTEIRRRPSLWKSPEPVCTVERTCSLARACASVSGGPSVVITGDFTDAGTEEQWGAVVDALALLRGRILAVPGNHDVTISATGPPSGVRQSEFQRFVAERTTLASRAAVKLSELGVPWSFPVFSKLNHDDEPFALVGLDSNRYASRFLLSNAIGFFGADQIEALSEGLKSLNIPLIAYTHHHCAWPGAGKLGVHRATNLAEEGLLIALDGGRVLAVLADYNKRTRCSVILIHGHRHIRAFRRYQRTGGEVLIYGAPSSTLGSETDLGLDGISRYAAIALHEGHWTVTETCLK